MKREGRPAGGTTEPAGISTAIKTASIVPLTGCPCGHLYDEECIRHIPQSEIGARYKAARRVVA